MNTSIKKYAFVLGRERELCLAELKAVLGYFCLDFDPFDSAEKSASLRADITSVTDNVVFINVDNAGEDLPNRLISRLGGVTKIFEIFGKKERDLSIQIAGYLQSRAEGKTNFGISSYTTLLNENATNVLGLKVKKTLKGLSALRFVALRGSKELQTIVSKRQIIDKKGCEFAVFNNSLGILAAVNNPEAWSERDYEKPAGDKYSGMLPPKLARMMVNIALGKKQKTWSMNHETCSKRALEVRNLKLEIPQHKVLVSDPFCGSGNVLIEAMMVGCDVFGSDSSEKAVRDTKANLDWLLNESGIMNQELRENIKYKISNGDATDPSIIEKLNSLFKIHNSTDRIAIVTEPFLGEPKKFKPSSNAVRGEYRKIKELYLGFFKNFLALQTFKLPIVLCIVFPLVETLEGKHYSLYKDCVDEIRKIGYTELQSPLIYGRDYQVVKREIALLKFQDTSNNNQTNLNIQ